MPGLGRSVYRGYCPGGGGVEGVEVEGVDGAGLRVADCTQPHLSFDLGTESVCDLLVPLTEMR